MSWADDGDEYLWEVRYYGSLYKSDKCLDTEQYVFVWANDIEEAIEAVREVHDENALFKMVCLHKVIGKEE